MKTRRSNLLISLTVIALILTPFLTSCGKDATATAVAEPTKVPPTAVPPTPTPKGPQVGGNVVIALIEEPTTLDVHKTAQGTAGDILEQLGATLITQDPTTGEYVPYLAKSWTMSEDGLTWDFVLRSDVKFHDGTPLTAHDYAWTFNRAIDPETKSTSVGVFIGGALDSAEAVDDYTLRFNLVAPSFSLLHTLVYGGWCQPLPQAAVEELGDEYGRHPIGVGPFKFKEWKTGEKVVLERNPDYNWGPEFIHGEPYIETLEFRIIPEYATIAAGLEAGEIDFYEQFEAKDLQRFKDTGLFEILEFAHQGMSPVLVLQVSKPPFDDLRVRKAFNLAVDRQTLIKVAELGHAVEQRGPMSPSMAGYWPGVEEIGYGYDLAQAKSLMEEAGYTYNADGMLEKDGQPFKVDLPVGDKRAKVAEILQEQFRALGVDVTIKLLEDVNGPMFGGDFEILVNGFGFSEAHILVLFFGNDEIGGVNLPKFDDPELQELLAATITTIDPAERQEVVNAVVTRVVEQALIVPLYATTTFTAMSTRIKNAHPSPVANVVWLVGAYIEAD